MNETSKDFELPWQDPIVQELHAIREKLVEKYQGNLHEYSTAARAHTLALGFKFAPTQPPNTSAAT